MKKGIALILSLVAFTATGCSLIGRSDEQKACDSEAEQLLADYSQPFIDKAKSIYGNDAEVTDITCMKFLATGLFDSVYMADERISGTLTLNGKQYEAEYNTRTDTLRDDVHTEEICSELLDALPIDQSKIIEKHYVDCGAYERFSKEIKLKFAPDIKTLDDVKKNKGEDHTSPVFIHVYTTEDLGQITESQLKAQSAFQGMDDCTQWILISIVSLKDQSVFSDLKTLMLRNSNLLKQYRRPDVKEESLIEFKNKFHIRNAAVIENDLFRKDDDTLCSELKIYNL